MRFIFSILVCEFVSSHFWGIASTTLGICVIYHFVNNKSILDLICLCGLIVTLLENRKYYFGNLSCYFFVNKKSILSLFVCEVCSSHFWGIASTTLGICLIYHFVNNKSILDLICLWGLIVTLLENRKYNFCNLSCYFFVNKKSILSLFVCEVCSSLF